MKLLFENWRRCLKEWVDDTGVADTLDDEAKEEPEEKLSEEEESIVRHNLEALNTLGWNLRGGAAEERFGLLDLNQEELVELVGNIPALRTNKIIKTVGSGTKKIAYKLDNDHIFSLFQSGYGGDEYSDLGWYAGIQDRQFGGESSVDEPAIHDYGEVPMPTWWTRDTLKYVEMSGVVPLSVEGPPSMRSIDPGRLDWDIVQIAKFVEASLYHGMLIKDPTSLDKKVELVQHWWRNRKGLPFAGEESLLDLEVKLSSDLIMNLIKTLVRLAVRLKTTFVLQDIHPGNLGMSIEKPDEFVVIDI